MNEIAITGLKDYLKRTALKQVMAFLVKKYAWAATGPIGFFLSFFLKKVIAILIDKTELGLRIAYIHLDAYLDAKKVKEITEKIYEKKKQGATDEELSDLDDELAKAGVDLIRFSSSN